MALTRLPNEILLLILDNLELEDQFRLSLTCQHFQIITRSNSICRMTFRKKARFSPEFAAAHETGDYALLWRRLVKRRMAIRSASPFQFSIVGVAHRFILAPNALIYKPGPGEARLLLLDGSSHEEVHIDLRQLAIQSLPTVHDWPDDVTIDPLYYSEAAASFLCQMGAQNYLILCNIKSGTILDTHYAETSRSIFSRTNDRYSYFGYKKRLLEGHWGWVIQGFDLQNRKWLSRQYLPHDFTGSRLEQDVCFEIFGHYLYGVSSASSSWPPSLSGSESSSFYHIFRMPLDGSSQAQLLPHTFCWRRDCRDAYVDELYCELKMAKDDDTGDIFLYETRKEWHRDGYSYRSCYRKNITFPNRACQKESPDEPPPSAVERLDPEYRPLPAQAGDIHCGDHGLEIPTGDNGKLYAYTYNTGTRSFIDIVGHVSDCEKSPGRLRLRVRPLSQDSDHDITSHSSCSPPGSHSVSAHAPHYWPPEPIPGRDDPTLDLVQTLMNPQGRPIQKVRWASNDRLLIFSPVSGTDPPALILVSFDPGLRLHGLRRVSGGPGRPIPTSLLRKPPRPHPDSTVWASFVLPFHLLIKSPEGKRYGFDFTQ